MLAASLLGYLYRDSLVFLMAHWTGSDDYGHGLFVPVISLFLIWQRRARMAAAGMKGSWWGVVLLLVGLALYWIGELATLYVILHVSLWCVVVGLVMALIGLPATKTIAFPLLYLLIAVPLPVLVHAKLSTELQLMSSAMGVGFLQAVGITAFREGNLIDLGPVQLQVADACSGIRYLLPLTSLALLCAYLFKDKMWKRVVLVLSSVPISLVVNGIRIAVIGVLVEFFGQPAAEGFLHFFEGWLLFMLSLTVLVLEMWALSRCDSEYRNASLSQRFKWDDGPLVATRSPIPSGEHLPGPAYLFGLMLFVPFALASPGTGADGDTLPARLAFFDFPMELANWHGSPLRLEPQYIEALRMDDYLLADYRADGTQEPVSLYAAYYRSQRKGQSAHSPQSCLPGGGWEIVSLNNVRVASAAAVGKSFDVNRAVIRKGESRQVVFYWFKQRERILTDEYLVKFYLLWDAVVRQRTDGALVRVASLVGHGETEEDADRRIIRFASAMGNELTRYVPD
ncbi:MAG TPA: VPLPA-CTERM-specific exosortase XrtD [Nitrospira sp.]|nr:VPLPA-CTERM-specific exosortase XrtD [Nitrospira sp.]